MSLFTRLAKYAAAQARAPKGTATGGQWTGRGALFGTKQGESVLHGYQRFLSRQYEELHRKTLARKRLRLVKYDSGQPRDPAGSPTGGQWTAAHAATTWAKDKQHLHADVHPGSARRTSWFRGSTPGFAGKWTTDEEWENLWFVASRKNEAYFYGPQIEQITVKKGAKILGSSSKVYAEIFGEFNDAEARTNRQYYKRGFYRAKALGWQVVSTGSQAGSVILDPGVVEKQDIIHVAKYDASQARVPAGNPGGGQWMDAAGSLLSAPSSAFPPATPHPETFARFRHPDGSFTPERQRLHEEIIKKHFAKKTPVEKPETIILGGGPASGKSTLLEHHPVPENFVHVDSDNIKKMLPEFREGTAQGDHDIAVAVHEESSHLSKLVAAQATQGQYNLLLDGTGDSGFDQLAHKIEGLRSPGRTINARYVTVDIETAIARANERGKITGRYPPEAYLRDTHRNISDVFEKAVHEGLFDQAELFDTNAPGTSVKIAQAEGSNLTVLDHKAWARFLGKAQTNDLMTNLTFALGAPSMVHPHELVSYLRAYGQEWKAAPLPKDVEPGKLGNCYENATKLIIDHPDWKYTEGVAFSERSGGLPFMHGWAVKPDGTVVDPTWPHPEKNRYFGVAYDRESYLAHIVKNRVYGVLGGKAAAARKVIDTGGEGLRGKS